MKYLIKFWDKHELIVSQQVGIQIKIAKEREVKCIKIDEALYETSAISYIEPIVEEQDELFLPEAQGDTVKVDTLKRMNEQLAKKFNWH